MKGKTMTKKEFMSLLEETLEADGSFVLREEESGYDAI
jgi:hypothetical protein